MTAMKRFKEKYDQGNGILTAVNDLNKKTR